MERELRAALARVRERIAEACARAGRDPGEVGLIAVSKTFPAERVRALIAAGHDVFGENRVQEALAKIDEVGDIARWHMVGTLQRNKARHVVGRFERIHAVDSESLAVELDRRARAAGVVQTVLIQVNQSGEATKSGVAPGDLAPLIDRVRSLAGLRLSGLTTVPPPVVRPEDNRRWFAALRETAARESDRIGVRSPELSMGMTDDFEVAIEEGATWVRVGRALFGARVGP